MDFGFSSLHKLFCLLGVVLLNCPILAAERHALLIGIGEYPRGIPSLGGPPHDVAAIRDLLVRSWGFRPPRITVLLEAEATRAKVLNALDTLAAKLGKGDFVFLYFSGHGTSAWAPNNAIFGMENHSGAIVPADLRPGPAREVLDQLIVSTRDLRPRLLKMDALATVFAAFDACYSGESVKSLATSHPGLVPRWADLAPRDTPSRLSYLSQFDGLSRENGQLAQQDNPFPYRRLIYISASAKSERAWDIPASVLASGSRNTIDGKPHGVFTNALLEGLSGQADLNHDGVISYKELHQFLVRTVQPDFGQFPQLLHPVSDLDSVASPVFGAKRVPQPAGIAWQRRKLRVRFEGSFPALEGLVAKIPDVELSTTSFDLLVREASGQWELRHSSGTPIRRYHQGETKELAARIRRQAAVHDLIYWRFPKPDFSVELQIQPSGREVYYRKEKVQPQMRPERDSYLMLVNVDVEGKLTVQYPLNARQALPAKAGEWVQAAQGTIGPPLGTEVLKLFAFRRKPETFDSFLNKSFTPEDPQFERFLKMVEREQTAAETLLVLFSTEGPIP